MISSWLSPLAFVNKVFFVQFPLLKLFIQIPNRMQVLHQGNLAIFLSGQRMRHDFCVNTIPADDFDPREWNKNAVRTRYDIVNITKCQSTI